jgi:hypothetical protein
MGVMQHRGSEHGNAHTTLTRQCGDTTMQVSHWRQPDAARLLMLPRLIHMR